MTCSQVAVPDEQVPSEKKSEEHVMKNEEVSREPMNTQEPSESPLQGNVGREIEREDRYYVQSLTAHIFVVRKSLSGERKPGPDDHIIRSFDNYHDASSYADQMNDEQGTQCNHTL